MKKVAYIATCLFIVLTIMGIFGFLYLTWNQYNDTKQWENSTFEGNMSDIPPELAKNYTNNDNKETVVIWARVGEAIEAIDKHGGITKDTVEGYHDIYEKAAQKQTDYHLQDGTIVQTNAQLQLYLDIFTFVQEAYTVPDGETLQKLSGQLETLMLSDTHSVNGILHTQLEEIATHYQALASFMEKTLPILGVIDNETLTASIDLTVENTTTILQEITTNDLTIFPYVKRLQTVLEDTTWSKILARNTITQNYHKWQVEKAILEALQKSDYYSVASITTLQQAKDMGITTPEKEKEGYTIDMNSRIVTLSYEGNALQSNQYIKKGTPISATVEVQYIKIPEKEPVPEKEPAIEKPNTTKPNTTKPNTTKPNQNTPNQNTPNQNEKEE